VAHDDNYVPRIECCPGQSPSAAVGIAAAVADDGEHMLARMRSAMTLLSDVRPLRAVLERPHGLLEAPRFGPDGEVVYSDVLAGGAWACSAEGEVRELLAKRRGIGGIVEHADGGWVLSGRNVVHLMPDGEQREVLSGEGVCGFNDLGVTPEGELLLGVLRYRPLAGEQPRPGQLLSVGAGGAVELLSEELTWPNGIGIAPDGQTIYVSDYARGVVLAVAREGGRTREFCRCPRGSADGLAVDREGGVWVALGDGAAVARFLAGGELHAVVPMPAGFVSSLCFGGPDMRDVLITTADNLVDPDLGGTLLRARSEIAGLSVAATRV
jgi:sugar lactone lactonase YvrE